MLRTEMACVLRDRDEDPTRFSVTMAEMERDGEVLSFGCDAKVARRYKVGKTYTVTILTEERIET